MFASTAHRVSSHTADHVNQAIRTETEEHLLQLQTAGPEANQCRLGELDREWDIDRVLELNFTVIVIFGLVLTVVHSLWWALLPSIAALFMMEHVLQGWCPPVPVFRRLKFRTQREIDEERTALKIIRGDFRNLTFPWNGQERLGVRRVLHAVAQ